MKRNIAGSLSLEGIDGSIVSYAGELLLLSSSLLDFKEKFFQTIEQYNSIDPKINPTKKEFLVYSIYEQQHNPYIRTSPGEVIRRSNSLRYLGVEYGCYSRMIRGLICQNVYKNLCSGYGKAVVLKNVVNRRVQSPI